LIANLLTGIRLLLVVPAAFAFARPELVAPWILLTVVLVAILTDYFDGKVARYQQTASATGQLFDHATDFLFVTAGLAGIAVNGVITPLLPILIVVAFSQYVLDSYFLYKDKHLKMNFLGRWNGVLYFVPLVLIAVLRLQATTPIAGAMLTLVSIIAWVLLLTTALSIFDRAIAPLRYNNKN